MQLTNGFRATHGYPISIHSPECHGMHLQPHQRHLLFFLGDPRKREHPCMVHYESTIHINYTYNLACLQCACIRHIDVIEGPWIHSMVRLTLPYPIIFLRQHQEENLYDYLYGQPPWTLLYGTTVYLFVQEKTVCLKHPTSKSVKSLRQYVNCMGRRLFGQSVQLMQSDAKHNVETTFRSATSSFKGMCWAP